MKKLTKYTDFDTLKSNAKTSNAIPVRDSKALSEFDTFLRLLQREYSNKKKNKAANGK